MEATTLIMSISTFNVPTDGIAETSYKPIVAVGSNCNSTGKM